MKRATSVNTAKARAGIAISLIKAGRTSSRSFSSCFEMGDGDEVVVEILKRAATDPKIEACYSHVAVWRKNAEADRCYPWLVECRKEAEEADARRAATFAEIQDIDREQVAAIRQG